MIFIEKLKIKISKIKANKHNPRFIRDDKFKKLVKSLKEFPEMLDVRPLVIDEDNVVLGGNMRLKALKEVGIKEVECKQVTNWTKEQKDEFIVKDNIGYGEWNYDALANEFDIPQVIEWGLDIPEFTFGDEEEDEEDLEADKVPEDVKTRVRLGDVWALGEHRLVCGDSTSREVVDMLMDGKKTDMVFTDPPYGINHSGKGITANGIKGNDFGKILGDQNVKVAIKAFEFCKKNFSDSILIFWGANYYPSCLPDGHGWLIWDKEKEGEIFSGGELAFVNRGVKVDIFRHKWHGMIKASEQGESRVHPTQKPIALAEWCFENYGDPKSVLDLFGGSGSTLIACEKTNRKCYISELDPKYCDVIISRWERYTGEIAVLEE